MLYLDHIKNSWRGLLLIFLVYLYFLLFAQFTFLQVLEENLGSGLPLKAVLGSMAAAGITGSLLASVFRKHIRSGILFGPLLIICSLVALVSPRVHSGYLFVVLAALMGLALGGLTVTIAATLPMLFPGKIRGRMVGAGTGLAYAACNLPIVFTATAESRAMASAIIPMVGGLLLIPFRMDADRKSEADATSSAHRYWTLMTACMLVCTFSLLIWFDSAIFYLIQENRSLRHLSWEGTDQLLLNATLHFVGAVIGGWMLDKSHGTPLLLLSWTGLALGAIGLQWNGSPGFVLVYVAAVSLYSTALVYIPSLHADRPGDRGSFVRASLVFSIAGWLCSGLGIGMAENLLSVPYAFILLSALIWIPVMKLSPCLK